MKRIKLIMLLAFMLIGMIGFSQTTLLNVNNSVDTEYKIYYVYEISGVQYWITDQISANASNYSYSVSGNATLISFKLHTNCVSTWVEFTAGTAADNDIDECHQCSNGNGANAGYDGTTTGGWLGIKCKE